MRPALRLGGALCAVSIAVFACGGSTSTPTSASQTSASGDDAGGNGSSSSSSGAGGSASGSSSGSASSSGSGSSSGSASGSSGSSGAPTGSIDGGAACAATGGQVVMIGDSYFALSESTSPPAGEITEHLQGLASAAGALASGDTYRYYYKSGANMATTYSSQITPIPTQFQQAVTANPDIKYVLMDGGGNDFLLENPQCLAAEPDAGPISQSCQTAIEGSIAAAKALFVSMQTAGVQKIVYFFYPHLPTAPRPSVNVILDYAFPLIQAACAASPVPCFLIDTRPAFDGHPEYIGFDNIHPTTAGSDVIAGLIWGEMQQACVALAP